MLKKRPIKNVHIYVLKDPETGEVRYVGKTKQTLRIRLRGHLSDKRINHRSCWIKSLKTRNLIPIMESIELVSDEAWQEREKYWIQHYKELGAKLVNGNDGGTGGHDPSAETRAKIGVASRNRSKETRAKIGAAHAGKELSAEHKANLSAAMKISHKARYDEHAYSFLKKEQ